MKIFIETKRLIIREILSTDVDAMFALDSDPEVHKYLGNKPITSKGESKKAINFIRQQYTERGIGRWAVVLKETEEFIGWSGLKLNKGEEAMNGYASFYDVGYRFIKEHWGKGYATESGKAAIQYAFDILKLETVYGITEMGNQASHNVLLKIGLDYIEDFFYKKDDMMLRWYKINNI